MDAIKIQHVWHRCQCGCIFETNTPDCPLCKRDDVLPPKVVYMSLEEVWYMRSMVRVKDHNPFLPWLNPQPTGF